ncbi:EAL domain-containing protein [Dyella sp. KRB-257]|uniref:EAL domain-containing protein n=1 Tax=Dyella sp. KRB-257 TaxID=3400915 RepID=UPI003C122593
MIRGRWLGSLRARVLALAMLAALPGFVIASMDTVASLRQAEGSARLSLPLVLGHAQHVYADVTTDAAAGLAVAASDLSGVETTCPDSFHVLARQHPEYDSIGVVRDDGETICTLRQPGRPAYSMDHALLRNAARLSGRPVITMTDPGASPFPRLVIAVAKPFPGSARKFIAFVSTAFPSLDKVIETVDVAAIPAMNEARLFFVDSAGGLTELGRGAPARVDDDIRKLVAGMPQRHASAAPGVVHVERMGGQLIAWLPLGEQAGIGSFVMSIASSTLYQSAWHTLIRNLSLMVAGLMAVLALIWSLGHRLILWPAQKLLTAMDGLARGDLHARTGLPAANHEIARLGMAFDRMAADIERQAAERTRHIQSLQRRNRLHAMLAAINAAILLRPSVSLLLEEICRIACEVGQFTSAWIGEVDAQEKMLRPVGWAGARAQAQAGMQVSLGADDPAGRSPSAVAASEGVVAVNNRCPADPGTAHGHHSSQPLGMHSAAAFPIGFTPDGRRRVFTLCVDRADYFETEEIELLEQLAQDAAFGLHMIATEQALAHSLTHETTTGLPNHVLLVQYLDDAIRHARAHGGSLVVGVLEIGFQQLVSQWGAQPADALLKWVGRQIEAQLGEDDFAGVLPGARFGLIMGNLDHIDKAQRQIDTLVERLLAGHGEGRDRPAVAAPRLGIAVFPDDDRDAQALLDKAQAVLAVSHDTDSEFVHFYTPAISLGLQENRKLEHCLRHAIADHELVLHYQPIIELASGRLHGFEALLRWNHPDLGQVAPDRFIALAESTGLILPMGDLVMSTAAQQALAWQRMGASDLVITLNVSAMQMRERNFAERVGQLLTGAVEQLSAVKLALEITESQLMTDVDRSASLLAELKAYGLGIIIDDFGTGYSSLSYLHRLPVDALKIDRTFTASMDSSRKAAMIVEGILALARSLAITTVAEGIERVEQLDSIRRMGGTYVQGFWFDRALPWQVAQQKWIFPSLD